MSTIGAFIKNAIIAGLPRFARDGSGNVTGLRDGSTIIPLSGAGGGVIALAATAWVETSGNDSTAALGNPALPFATLDAALSVLPSPGKLNIGLGTFAPVTDDLVGSILDVNSKLKSDIWFCGSGMPRFKSDNTALEGGTIIQGTLLAHSTRHGLKFTDLGIDCGSAVCAALYGGAPADTLDFANVGQIVGQAQCEGVVVHNVRTLCMSAAGTSHTMLFENLKNPDVRNISGRFGSLGIVIKSDGGTFDGINSSGHATSALYIKEGNTGSNSAPCKEVNIANVSLSAVSAGDTPTGVTMVAAAGQPLKGIQINNLDMRGITTAEFVLSSESGAVSDCRISNARTDAGAIRVNYVASGAVDKSSIFINGENLNDLGTSRRQYLEVACSDESTALTAGASKITFRMPRKATLVGVRAQLNQAQTSGSIFTIDINEAGVSVLSTKLTIDNTEQTSTTAATPAVISDPNIADDAQMSVDIDQIGDGTAKGLKVLLIWEPA